jgi:NAD(P)-dependent dehydrogenase (short-subunit alcohol dehydrogenase family)
MKEFKNKVAVITGAASGIGVGLAERCAEEGMKIVLADIDEKGLKRLERRLTRAGATILTVITDVSKPEEIEALAQKTLESFGKVHILFNNAGVAMPNLTWEYKLEDWDFVLGVNLFGVIYGIKTFVPIMIEQDTECHIVNTSSIEGVIAGGVGGATYGVAKHALVFLSERLTLELEELGPKIKVSVLCPGFVKTKIFASALKRAAEYLNMNDLYGPDTEQVERLQEFVKESPGISPQEVANIVFQAIKDEQLYIFTHKQSILKDAVKERFIAIISAFDK